jgi:hypothetical protein
VGGGPGRGVHAGTLQRGLSGAAAQQSGIALAWVPLVMVAMNLVYSALAYPLDSCPTA